MRQLRSFVLCLLLLVQTAACSRGETSVDTGPAPAPSGAATTASGPTGETGSAASGSPAATVSAAAQPAPAAPGAQPAAPAAAASGDLHASQGVKPGSHEDWCGEHQVPESLCTRCNPSLIAAFKATNDWCAEHGLPESQCLKCNPDLKIVRPPREH